MRSFLLGAKTEVQSDPYNGYIADGLATYLDGIDNTGSGHDSSATVWTDLVSGVEIPFSNPPTYINTFGLNHLLTDGGSYLDIVCDGTLEVCFDCYSHKANYGWILDGGAFGGMAKGPRVSQIRTSTEIADMGLAGWGSATLNSNTLTTFAVTLSDKLRMYKDGVMVADAANNSTATATEILNGYNHQRGTVGRIYAVRNYSRALSADELSANYAVDARRFGL